MNGPKYTEVTENLILWGVPPGLPSKRSKRSKPAAPLKTQRFFGRFLLRALQSKEE